MPLTINFIAGNIDLAIHSAKDVPVATDERIINLAYLERGCTDDLVIMRKTSGTPSLETILQNREPTSLFDIMKWFLKVPPLVLWQVVVNHFYSVNALTSSR